MHAMGRSVKKVKAKMHGSGVSMSFGNPWWPSPLHYCYTSFLLTGLFVALTTNALLSTLVLAAAARRV